MPATSAVSAEGRVRVRRTAGEYHAAESQKFLESGLFTGLTMTLPALNDLGWGGRL